MKSGYGIRTVLFVLGVAIVVLANLAYNVTVVPEVGSAAVLNTLERSDENAVVMRTYQATEGWRLVGNCTAVLVLFMGCFWQELKSMYDVCKGLLKLTFMSSILLLCFSGCAYDKPVFVQVDTSETAFVVKLEGDSAQGTINSEEYLQDNMVATKRIQVSYRWVKLGRGPLNGKYMPNERVIVVDRSPETREWVSDNRGTNPNQDQGIWVESSDSVGFSTGISITARVASADDAVKVLYNYPPKGERVIPLQAKDTYKDDYIVSITDLADVMDSEIRTEIQAVFSEKAAEFDMNELRSKKNEIINAIRERVIPFFAERGITITAIGIFGGFTYENPEIQTAIDDVFKAQQDEEVAKAEALAAEQRKEALKLQGEGRGEELLQAKLKEAEGIQAIADAKAYEIEQAQKDIDAYLKLKQLEIEMKRLEQWDGKYPIYYLDSGYGGGGLNMFVPSPTNAPSFVVPPLPDGGPA